MLFKAKTSTKKYQPPFSSRVVFYELVDKTHTIAMSFGLEAISRRHAYIDEFSARNPDSSSDPHTSIYFNKTMIDAHGGCATSAKYAFLSEYKRLCIKTIGLRIKKHKLSPSAIHQIAMARTNKYILNTPTEYAPARVQRSLFLIELDNLIRNDSKLKAAYSLWRSGEILKEPFCKSEAINNGN